MSRAKGSKYGEYGKRGASRLAKRRRLERDNPGFCVCRDCDQLFPESERVASEPTPYCKPCRSAYARTFSERKPKKETALATVFRRQKASPPGMHYCRSCDSDLPESSFPQWRGKPQGAKCLPCVRERQRRASRKYSEKDTLSQQVAFRIRVQTNASERKIRRRLKTYEFALSSAVAAAFRALRVVKCSKHGWAFAETGGRGRFRCKECRAPHSRKHVKLYKKKYPEKVREHRATVIQNRRARKWAAPCEVVRRVKVAERDGWICYLCGCEVTRKNWSLDHVVPLSKGGHHTYANCRLACHLCNSRKGATLLQELTA